MKKYFLCLVFTMINILSFGYDGESVWYCCECHGDYLGGYDLFCKSNDTLIYYNSYKIENDNTSKIVYEYHYHKIEYNQVIRSINDVPFYKGYNLEKIPNIPNEPGLPTFAKEFCEYTNILSFLEIPQTFKYGYIDSYSWSLNSASGINFEIKYANTNPKTIKYIDIYFIVKNPVNDICEILYNNGSNICHLRCVGPLEPFNCGSWNWDAAYYTTRDAHYLHLTKFVITYMDGTKYTLVKELAYKHNIRE